METLPIWIYWMFGTITILWWIFWSFMYGFFDELEDKCVNSQWEKPFKIFGKTMSLNFLNKKGNYSSWKRKWKLDENNNPVPYEKKWYHFGVVPAYEELFPYSSTIMVWKTDGEHYFQFLKNRSIEAGLSLPLGVPAIFWIIGKSIFTFTKEKWMIWLDMNGGR